MITLNPRDGRPIYEQIQESFQRLIHSGALAPGEKMPSVRQLAGQLAINPNTIQRAYAQLEAAGYLVSLPGKGSFVADGRELSAVRRAQLEDQLCGTAAELLALGATRAELDTLLDQTARSRQEEKHD